MRTLAVRCRSHNQFVQRFQAPTLVHEFSSQPIQQVGVRRRGSRLAKVSGRCHQAFAKVILPDTVHHNTRRQRMVGLDQPARKG